MSGIGRPARPVHARPRTRQNHAPATSNVDDPPAGELTSTSAAGRAFEGHGPRLAIIFGAVSRHQAAVKNGAGMAKAGIILGIVDVVLWLVLLLVAANNGGFGWYVGG
jgi:hypothetical protein